MAADVGGGVRRRSVLAEAAPGPRVQCDVAEAAGRRVLDDVAVAAVLAAA